jgi:ribosome biogenesis protein BMS1
VDALPDPCPLPEKERGMLKSKETLLYAPMANVGAVRYDADAMYISLRQLQYTKVSSPAVGRRTSRGS